MSMKINKSVAVGVACIALLLGGCTKDVSPNTYDAADAGQVNRAVPGKIIAMRQIKIDASSGLGGPTGVAAGAIAGSAIGGSPHVSILSGIGGAILGGVLGHAIDKGVGAKQGMEYVVKLKSGNVLTVAQGADLQLRVGQQVYIIYGKQTRIVPADSYAG